MNLIAEPFAAGPQRDRWGRPLIVPPEGGKPVAYLRPSSLPDQLNDDFNISRWRMRQLVLGMGKRRDLWQHAATLTGDDKTKLQEIADAAMEMVAEATQANLGSAIHAYLQNGINRPDDMPEVHACAVGIRAAMEAEGMTLLADTHEVFVINDDIKCAGSIDGLVLDGDAVRVWDIKTTDDVSSVPDYKAQKWAIQLAIYANANRRRDGVELHDSIDRTQGVVCYVSRSTGECRILRPDLVKGYIGAKLARAAYDFKKAKAVHFCPELAGDKPKRRKRSDPPATAAVEAQNPDMGRSIEDLIADTNDVQPAWVRKLGEQSAAIVAERTEAAGIVVQTGVVHYPECNEGCANGSHLLLADPTGRPAALKRRIDDLRAAGHLPLLKANWPADIPMGNPTTAHTTQQLDAIEGALWAVEGAVRAPFPGADEPVPAKPEFQDFGPASVVRHPAPDEGGPLDAATVAELKTTAGSIRTAAPKQWGWVERALRDMRQLGHPLDVSNNPTVRTGALLRALMAVSAIAMEADGDNGVRALLASVTGSEQACHPTVSIPEFFATLTIDEARALCALLDMQPTIVKGTAA